MVSYKRYSNSRYYDLRTLLCTQDLRVGVLNALIQAVGTGPALENIVNSPEHSVYILHQKRSGGSSISSQGDGRLL
jgi:hypothetical protein